MRFHLLTVILMAGAAVPAASQQPDRSERRLEKLEQEMRAVQRRVFPGGAGATVQPEISPQGQPQVLTGSPASSAVADLTARLDALESQLAAITGQSEQNANRVRQLEEAFARVQRESESRLAALEAARAQAPAPGATEDAVRAAAAADTGPATTARPSEPARTDPQPAGEWVSPPAGAAGVGQDRAEQAYNSGFRLWEQRRYAEARRALAAVARDHARSRWVSWANNLIGRAHLDEGDAAAAARVLLANYQDNPKGERAADSLYFLGEALTRLEKRSEACKVYEELEDVYGATMRPFLRERLPAARTAARCS